VLRILAVAVVLVLAAVVVLPATDVEAVQVGA
jgi:hypothetical protein